MTGRRVLHRILVMAAAVVSTAAARGPTWTTLGTNSGPVPNAKRSEPANLLRVGREALLIDCGDGASVQLAKAGVPVAALQTVILSHLHFDHIGGLFALIAERYQMRAPGVLVVYGPPGTRVVVDGLLAAMRPSPPAGVRDERPAAETVEVVEVGDGAHFVVGDVRVTAAANAHYIATPGGERFVSLAYRFDLPGRTIAYTGDTGPSAAAERLAQGADLLVSKTIDAAAALDAIRRTRPDASPAILAMVKAHFEQEHLSPREAGLLAQYAGAKMLVLTHDAVDPDVADRMRAAIAAGYRGPIRFARDLDVFTP